MECCRSRRNQLVSSGTVARTLDWSRTGKALWRCRGREQARSFPPPWLCRILQHRADVGGPLSRQTMALWISLPVARSQMTAVSRWLVMPMAVGRSLDRALVTMAVVTSIVVRRYPPGHVRPNHPLGNVAETQPYPRWCRPRQRGWLASWWRPGNGNDGTKFGYSTSVPVLSFVWLYFCFPVGGDALVILFYS